MSEPRCPLLVIRTGRRRTPIDINGQRRLMRDVEELTLLQKSRLARHTRRIDALLEQSALTDREKRELGARLRRASRIVLTKSTKYAEIEALSGTQQLLLLRTFAAVAAERPASCRVPKAVRERYAREDAERAARNAS